MSKLVYTLGLFLACFSVQAQTICTPNLGGGFDCIDYGVAAFIDIRPRIGHEIIESPEPQTDRHDTFRVFEAPRIGGQLETYNYETGEFRIITPNPGGGFTIDKY